MAEKIIIVDDDPLVGDLTTFLLKDAGYDTELISDSLKAIAAIKEKQPAMAILDILMPGIDGLTLCQQIKSDPELKTIKVAIVSGKSFQADKDRAEKFGADAFIEKPYNVESFAKRIRDILGTAETKLPAPKPAPAAASAAPVLEIKVWGCRGPMETPLAASRYGRKTSCLSVEFKDRLLVFDAGSGLTEVGSWILAKGKHRKTWLFLTHFHPDHMEGLGSFACARAVGHTICITGANDPEKSLQTAVAEAFEAAPSTEPLSADIQLYEVFEDAYEIMPGVKITSFYANHPTTTLGYKLQTQGRTLIFSPVSEIYGEAATAQQDYDQKLGALCQGADIMIHDAHFTDEDYEAAKNQGHSSFANAIHFAARFKIKQIVLFHYSGKYSDETLDQMVKDAEKIIADNKYELKCVAATEGMTLAV